MVYLQQLIPQLLKLLMTSEDNFAKVRRLTSTLSPSLSTRKRYSTIDSQPQAESFKLPAINAITKAVKYNDISFSYPRRTQRKLRLQPESEDTLAESLAHSSLLQVRKRYNNMTKKRENEQNRITILQIERDKFVTEKKLCEDKLAQASAKANNLNQKLLQLKLQFSEADMERKSLAHIAQRMKADHFLLQKRKKRKFDEFQFLGKQRELLRKQEEKMREETSRVQKVYRKMVDHVQQDSCNRDNHIQSMKYMIGNKVTAYHREAAHRVNMKEIAEHTFSEKDPKEQEWLNLYLSHHFVEELLRDKLAKEMAKFKYTEDAYKKIKTETGVESAESLVSKYLNRQQSYGYLLSAIASQQKQILQLKAERQQLNRQTAVLKDQEEALNIGKKEEINLSQQQKEFNTINQQLTKDYLFEQIMKFWLRRNLKKMELKQILIGDKKEVLKNFETYIKLLIKEIQDLGQIQEGRFDSQLLLNSNNTRIQKDPESPERKQTPSSCSEDEHIELIRRQTIKANDEFISTLRERYQQIKKHHVEGRLKYSEVLMD